MKKSLIFVLALMLVFALASTAMAAQPLDQNKTGYLSTSAGAYYTTLNDTYEADLKFNRNPRFNADGITNYPYEIYLPNEQNPNAYRIHSNYAKNTDACASCHATHTAVGASLLQWYSAYETCMACHDGTLGSATYNVLDGKIGNTSAPTVGGMFGDGTQLSGSNHNATGYLDISAAPGGSTIETEQVAGAHGTKNTRWINEFGCESCHSPHGQGGNARILHPDPNFAASWEAEKRAVANKYFVEPVGGKVYANANYTTPVYIIKGYPYSTAVINGDLPTKALKISNVSGTSVIVNADGTPATLTSAVYVTGVASLQVKMTVTNYLQATETVNYVYGMNFYCGACHTDYNTAAFTTTGAAEEQTGVYTQAHRHQMGMQWYSPTVGLKFESGTMNCLTCHVAHGTSQDYWAATLGGKKGVDGTTWSSVATDSSLEELAGSSALKRMPNMGTCEACHAKGEGSEGYNANAGITLPDGYAIEGISDSLTILKSASYIGMNSAAFGVDSCITCHQEAVKAWAETQHNMFAPYENELTLTEGNRYLKASGKGLNSTEESIKLLEELYVASENYQPTVNGYTYAKGIVAQIKAYIDAQGAKYDNAYNDAISAKDIFTVGQLPIGSRYKMEAMREYIVRLYDNTDSQYEYVVIGAAVWEPALNEWEIEGAAYLEGEDNYTGSCFNCHFSLTTGATASASGTANEAGKDSNRVWLDGYYNYLYAGAAKPARDFGISCEACHGAASKHVAAPTATNIMNPAKFDTTVQSRICGRCHVSSGNKNSSFAFYQPWKLVSNEAITPGVVADLVYPTTVSYAYNTYATQMDAFFKAGWESYELVDGEWVLPASDYTSSSATEWTYKSKEGRAWGTGGHTQYTTFALNQHFSEKILSCSSCHDSHSGAKGEFQLKLDPVRLCEACHSSGGGRMAVKLMPKQSANNVRMHDFGNVIDEETGKFFNTNITGQPRYDAGVTH